MGENAEALVESNYFENARRPHWNTGDGLIDADLNANRYTGVSATDEYRDSGSTVFRDITLYPYTLDSNINEVPNIVNNGSGPK